MAAKKRTVKNKKKDSASVKKSKGTVKKKEVGKLEQLTEKLNSLRAKRYFPFLLLALVVVTVLYFGRSYLFAALVGGRPITRVKLINELEKQGGQQALESLVTKELVNQEAAKRGVNISDVDISVEVKKIKDLLEQQGTTLDAALSMQGQTMDDLEENIRLQKTVEELLKDSINVSDEDILNYFEENKSYYGEDVEFNVIKDSIADQLRQEKLSSEFQNLLERLKSEGNIIYFVDFE